MKTNPDWQFASSANIPETKTRLIVRIGVLLAVLNLLLVLAGPLARHYELLPVMTAFRLFFNSVLAGLVLGVLGLLLIITTWLSQNRYATGGGWLMLLPGLLPAVIVLAITGPASLGKPMIHDISTDTSNPQIFVEVKKQRTADQNPVDYKGAEIADLQMAAYPDIKPIISSMNTDDALTEATQVVKDLGWEFINVDYNNGIVEAYDRTRIFGFTDDIIFRIKAEGSGSRIDVRSASRYGKGDLGKNAERIRLVIKTFRSS